MKIDGGCHCGHVTYEAEIDADNVVVCHCTDCQKLSGSPFRVTAIAATDAIRMTGNETRVYEKLGETGRKRFQHFCPQCGSQLFTSGEGEAAAITGIRWGSINQRETLKPGRQVWCRSAAPWIDAVAPLPARDKG